MVGDCPCTIAYGGIHGAIPCYREEATETRTIRNKDVASYYPHQMILNGYCSRNIPSPDVYAATIERRVKAKKAGDKATANALKLVLNTTYGAMLNKYNDLYDPLMGRSVCISGQLQLLEMAVHLIQDCPTLKIIQLNTDGIMVSLDDKVILKMNPHSTKLIRRKLRSFHGKVERGEMALSDIRNSIDSYHGHMKRGNSFKVRERTNQYFKSMFGFYPNKKGWESNVSNVKRRNCSGNSYEPCLGQKAG